jgi:hypothetical protein
MLVKAPPKAFGGHLVSYAQGGEVGALARTDQ